MIRSFRNRFILITMALLAVVSLIALTSIGIFVGSSLKGDIDQALERAVNMNTVDLTTPFIGGRDDADRKKVSIPVYCVSVDGATGTIYERSGAAAQMDSDTVVVAVNSVLSRGEQSGYLEELGLFYKAKTDLSSYQIAFADSSNFDSSIRDIVFTLVGVWGVLLLVLLIVVMFLSRFVTKPVEQAWENQQRFIADASHELKTPLTIILADASILKSEPTKTMGEQAAWVEGVESEALRMKDLTEDLLTLASADAGVAAPIALEPVDFSQIVTGSILQFEAVAFERGLTLTSDVANGLEVVGDNSRFERLLKTLLENACKYAGEKGDIRVALISSRSQAVLTVKNSGDPIPPEDLGHIFDRFFRSDKSRVREGETAGFGLGLAISKATVEEYKGTISVTSDASGTEFTVRLPLAKQ